METEKIQLGNSIIYLIKWPPTVYSYSKIRQGERASRYWPLIWDACNNLPGEFLQILRALLASGSHPADFWAVLDLLTVSEDPVIKAVNQIPIRNDMIVRN